MNIELVPKYKKFNKSSKNVLVAQVKPNKRKKLNKSDASKVLADWFKTPTLDAITQKSNSFLNRSKSDSTNEKSNDIINSLVLKSLSGNSKNVFSSSKVDVNRVNSSIVKAKLETIDENSNNIDSLKLDVNKSIVTPSKLETIVENSNNIYSSSKLDINNVNSYIVTPSKLKTIDENSNNFFAEPKSVSSYDRSIRVHRSSIWTKWIKARRKTKACQFSEKILNLAIPGPKIDKKTSILSFIEPKLDPNKNPKEQWELWRQEQESKIKDAIERVKQQQQNFIYAQLLINEQKKILEQSIDDIKKNNRKRPSKKDSKIQSGKCKKKRKDKVIEPTHILRKKNKFTEINSKKRKKSKADNLKDDTKDKEKAEITNAKKEKQKLKKWLTEEEKKLKEAQKKLDKERADLYEEKNKVKHKHLMKKKEVQVDSKLKSLCKNVQVNKWVRKKKKTTDLPFKVRAKHCFYQACCECFCVLALLSAVTLTILISISM